MRTDPARRGVPGVAVTLTGTTTVVVLVVAAALVLYLVAALVFPERF
ncbi:hypothetical protein GCM10009722_34090 [Williamsia deligens]